MKKSKSRFQNPDGGYRQHTQTHKSKKYYNRQLSKKEVTDILLDLGSVDLEEDELEYLRSLYPEDKEINDLINKTL